VKIFSSLLQALTRMGPWTLARAFPLAVHSSAGGIYPGFIRGAAVMLE
jgi:hypothetical protein